LNNYEKTTDEFNFWYKRYKKIIPWKAFKKICGKKKNGWIEGQILCEKYKIILTGHRTRPESYKYYFDLIIRKIHKFLKGSGQKKKKNYEKIFFGKSKKHKKLRITKEKPYDFDKMNNNLLGVKKKIW